MEIAISSQLGFNAWLTIAVMALCLAVLLFELIKPEIALSSAVIILTGFGVISPTDALAGFSNSAILTVALLFIVVAALRQSGVIFIFSQWLLGNTRNHHKALARLLATASVTSAFINNTPVVAMLTDATSHWCKKHHVAISKLLIPLSYATIAGGMCTLIGTSTNLIIVGLMQQYPALPKLHMFSPAWVGIPVTLITLVYLFFFGQRLLPENYAKKSASKPEQKKNSALDKNIAKVTLWLRKSRLLLQRSLGLQYAEQSSTCVLTESFSTEPDADEHHLKVNQARNSVAILFTMIIASAVFHVDIFIAALAAVGALLLSANISIRQAIKSIDYALIISIASAFALGMALDKTGVANAAAMILLSFAQDDPFLTLVIIYVLTVTFTEFLTNNAAAVLMFPIALASSEQLAVSAMPFIMAVMIAASASFITPIGYQTNMMVYGPGQYRFIDYVKVGTPLSILVGIVAMTIIPLVWSFKVPFALP